MNMSRRVRPLNVTGYCPENLKARRFNSRDVANENKKTARPKTKSKAKSKTKVKAKSGETRSASWPTQLVGVRELISVEGKDPNTGFATNKTPLKVGTE